jgi:cell division protein FtsW
MSLFWTTTKDGESVLKLDFWLLAVTLLMAGAGLIMVLSASGVMAEKHFADKYFFFRKQALFLVLGMGLMILAAWVPLQSFFRMKYWLLAGVFLLLVLTQFSVLGAEVNGARRWLRFGAFAVQPMEFAKFALVVYLAWFLSQKQELIRTFSVGVIPPFAVSGLLSLLVLMQPDFGGAVFLCMLLFLMCLVGGTRPVYLFCSLAMAAGAAWMLILQSPYRTRRLLAFMDPFKDALDSGYQLVQSLYAFGSGGFFGRGLGAGKQKLFFLPEAHNDFIMAVVGEELGFLGVSAIFILMGVLLLRAFQVALAQEDMQERLAGFGMALILSLGAVLNMAVVLGTAPPKGVPMPFLSYGGSSLICSFLCVGVLLNLSRPKVTRGREQAMA